MGQLSDAPGAPINEGVFLLNKLSHYDVEDLHEKYPHIPADNLKTGIFAGPEEEDPANRAAMARDKAHFMLDTLAAAKEAAQTALVSVARKVKSARVQRLISQILVHIESSSSLATLALGKKRAAIVSAVLTLLAALGNLFAEYQEKLINPQAGNLYDAFQRLSEGVYKTGTMSSDLTLALKYEPDVSQLEQLIAKANALCEELNGWLIQLVSTMIPA